MNILFGMVLILSVLLNRVIVQVMMTRPEQLEEDPTPGGRPVGTGHGSHGDGAMTTPSQPAIAPSRPPRPRPHLCPSWPCAG